MVMLGIRTMVASPGLLTITVCNLDMTELPVTSMDEKYDLNLFCEQNVQLHVHRSMSAFDVLQMCLVLPVSTPSNRDRLAQLGRLAQLTQL